MGAAKVFATLKSVWICNGQKLIQNRTHNEYEVFMAAPICAVACNFTAAFVMNAQEEVCIAHDVTIPSAQEQCLDHHSSD